MSTAGGTKAIVAALIANMGIAITKLFAWALTGMSSMLAEGIHSLADSGNQILLLIGGKRAQKAATKEHPFGYGRERYLAAFVVSIVLFSLGGLFALYEGYHKWEATQAGTATRPGFDQAWWWVPMLVLTIGIVLEGWSFRTAVKESQALKGRSTWVNFIRRAKKPELPVILLEDFAALIGLVFALISVVLAVTLQDARWDAIGTVLIGVLLVVVAVVLAVEMRSLLLGESAAPETIAHIQNCVTQTPTSTGIIHLKTMHIGPEELLVAMKVGVTAQATGAEIAAMIDDVEQRIREGLPELRVLLYVEPDIRGTANRVESTGAPAS